MNSLSLIRRKLNNGLLRFSYRFGLSRVLASLPNSLDIETTNCCSLDCFKCPRKDMGRPEGSMSLDLFKKIMDDAAPEVIFCWLHLFGEPLLNRNLPNMIAYARSRDIRCGISTNGIGLTGTMGKRLCDAGLDTLIISLDAVEKTTYDIVRPGGDFDTIVKNTEAFLALPEKAKVRETIIQMIAFDANKGEAGRFIEKWKGPGRKVHIKNEETWAGYIQSQERKEVQKRVPCRKLWERLTIDWQGNVSICCRDYSMSEVLGNVRTESLASLWNGKRMVALRKLMTAGKYDAIPLCKNCREWDHHITGNFTEY